MSQELHYTSAPRGLWPGSQGYCTVAATAQMSRGLAERLEGLSAYRNIFPPHDPRAAQNPVVLSHVRVAVAGTARHVLSRVGFAGVDYTGRTNKYAHHVVLDPSELPRGGPAWLLSQPRFLRASWDGHVGWIDTPLPVPRGDIAPGVCRAWQTAVGDAGWAGVLAEAFLTGSKPVAYLVHEPSQDLLPLILEAQALLPPERRWELTFSTYVTTLPQGVVCAWRGVVRGTPEEAQARRAGQALVLDLNRSLGRAPAGALVEQARTGRLVAFPPALNAKPAIAPPQAEPPVPFERAPVAASRSVATDAPRPPAVERPLSPREWAGTPWPRRARAIVAVACLVLLVIGAGVAWQVAVGPRKSGLDNAPKTALATAPASKEQSARPALDPKQQTEKSSSPSAKVETAALDAAAPGAQQTPRPVDRDSEVRSDEIQSKPGKRAAAEEEGKSQKGGGQPPKPMPQPRYEYLAEELPPLNSPDEDHSINNLLTIKNTEIIRVIGLADSQYEVLKTPQKADGLDLFCVGGAEPFARFWVAKEGIRFRWMPTSTEGEEEKKKEKEAALALRSSVLEVVPTKVEGSDSRVTRIVLRRLDSTEKPLFLNDRVRSLKFNWGGDGEPFGRRLEIGNCDIIYNSKIYSMNVKYKDDDSVGFSNGELDGILVKFERENAGRYPAKYQLSPTEPEAIEKVREGIEELKATAKDVVLGGQVSKFETLKVPKLRETFDFTATFQSIPKTKDVFRSHEDWVKQRIAKAEEEVRNADEEAKKEKEPEKTARQKDADKYLGIWKGRLETTRRVPESLDKIRSAYQLVERIKALNKDCQMRVTLTMLVDGEPVVVARVGYSKDEKLDKSQMPVEAQK